MVLSPWIPGILRAPRIPGWRLPPSASFVLLVCFYCAIPGAASSQCEEYQALRLLLDIGARARRAERTVSRAEGTFESGTAGVIASERRTGFPLLKKAKRKQPKQQTPTALFMLAPLGNGPGGNARFAKRSVLLRSWSNRLTPDRTGRLLTFIPRQNPPSPLHPSTPNRPSILQCMHRQSSENSQHLQASARPFLSLQSPKPRPTSNAAHLPEQQASEEYCSV